MNILRKHMQVYFVMGSNNCDRNPEVVLKEALEAGVTCFQYREKGEGAKLGIEKLELGARLKELCNEYEVPFIVNDDVELAIQLDADGVHIGQEDGNITSIREKIGNEKIVGVSTHNVEEALRAVELGADYIGVGPMYFTSTKKDIEEVKGPSVITAIREAGVTLPIVGIGGINISNAKEVMEAGADGVAVISAISKAENVEETVIKLQRG
ncbi:thiamine-phosphate diphosphorylase [Sutcliffiella cohnii]|uniref:Thiamine-phosphate synthase n=1 Tax=Sutcliffiella cohnii TaxID=33932 RepID=A0A223KLS7_9BACI|nr:thiamine phosphate synthase [Sutcliffiella cohnii]AST90445.1 thiamine-phosphate diphosphorylase [Sutcliffiella cohnii]